MKKYELLNKALKEQKYDDSLEAMILYAYIAGREQATKEVSDNYTTLIKEMRERANNSRYHIFANNIIGDKDYIWHDDYAQDHQSAFCDTEVNI